MFQILCKLFVLFLLYTTSVDSVKLSVGLPGIEDNWETQLETGLVALETNCDQNYIPFNREKVQKDLKQCLRSIIAQQPTNYYNVLINPSKYGSTSQMDIFRHIYIEPICNKITQSLGCLQPHRVIIDNCAREDGKALQQLMNVSCRGNGSKLVEFLEAGGIDCILSQRESILNCFTAVTETKRNLTTSTEVCTYFRESRDCFLNSLFRCAKPLAGNIIQGIFEEVAASTGGNCLVVALTRHNDANSRIQGISWMFTAITAFITWGRR